MITPFITGRGPPCIGGTLATPLETHIAPQERNPNRILNTFSPSFFQPALIFLIAIYLRVGACPQGGKINSKRTERKNLQTKKWCLERKNTCFCFGSPFPSNCFQENTPVCLQKNGGSSTVNQRFERCPFSRQTHGVKRLLPIVSVEELRGPEDLGANLGPFFEPEGLPKDFWHTKLARCWHINKFIYIPGTQMTSIFEGQPPKTRSFPIKTRVIWVPGIYTYVEPLKNKAVCPKEDISLIFGRFIGSSPFPVIVS